MASSPELTERSFQSSPTASLVLEREPSPHRLSRVLVGDIIKEALQSPATEHAASEAFANAQKDRSLSPISGGLAASLDTTLLCGKLGHSEVLPPQCMQPIAAVAERVQNLRQYFESQKQMAMHKALQAGNHIVAEAPNGIIPQLASANDGDLDSCEADDDHLEADDAYVGEVLTRVTRQLEILQEILDLAAPLPPTSKRECLEA